MSIKPTTPPSSKKRSDESNTDPNMRIDRANANGDMFEDLMQRGLTSERAETAGPAEASLGQPETHAIQVEPEHYGRSYFNIPRMVGYLYQADAVRQCGGRSALEIGVGTGITSHMMRLWGIDLHTLDLDRRLKPNCVGDGTRMPFCDNAFDTVLMAETLEHFPFEEFVPALRELRRVAREHVIISLPAPLVGFSLGINICGIHPKFMSLGLPQWSRPVFDGQHYWEMNRRGYPKRKIRKAIREAGLEIVKEYRPAFSLYIYFFILRKI